MSRKPRIHQNNGFYYVSLSGNGDREIFLSVHDSEYFEKLIEENLQRYGCSIHGYCWVKNQAYMLIQINRVPLTKFVHNIAFRYTYYFNRKYKESGHLYQGRYRARLVQSGHFLKRVLKFIHVVPLSTGTVTKPQEYKWSSHRAYIDRADTAWLTTDYILSLYSDDRSKAIELYNEYTVTDINPLKAYELLVSGDPRIIGDKEFINDILSHRRETIKLSSKAVVKAVCTRFDLKIDELASRSRGRELSRVRTIIGYLIQEFGDTTLSEYGRLVKRDVSTLSIAVAKYRTLLKTDKQNQLLIAELKKDLVM